MRAKLLVLILVSLFLIFPKLTFAADIKVSGKIFDQNNNPVPNSTVVFTTSGGKTIKAVNADFSGFYQTDISQGKYTIIVSAPKEASAQQVTIADRTISSSSNIDFVLKTPTPSATQRNARSYLLPIAVGAFFGLIVFIIFVWLILKRKKKKEVLPESSSPH